MVRYKRTTHSRNPASLGSHAFFYAKFQIKKEHRYDLGSALHNTAMTSGRSILTPFCEVQHRYNYIA